MRIAVVIFPGSNCDRDIIHVLRKVCEAQVVEVWHKEVALPSEGVDAVVLPGGFSYGDYLRSGAIARFSPIMPAVINFAENGGLVWGICNGFQILCESGLLPGALLRNEQQKFICDNTWCKVERTNLPLTSAIPSGAVLKLPIAHAEGRYYADDATIAKLEANNQVVLRYTDRQGMPTKTHNPNGSVGNIAGICNEAGNVVGMMPHPERGAEPELGNEDGRLLFESLSKSFASSAIL